jgi:hypothetical protein
MKLPSMDKFLVHEHHLWEVKEGLSRKGDAIYRVLSLKNRLAKGQPFSYSANRLVRKRVIIHLSFNPIWELKCKRTILNYERRRIIKCR